MKSECNAKRQAFSFFHPTDDTSKESSSPTTLWAGAFPLPRVNVCSTVTIDKPDAGAALLIVDAAADTAFVASFERRHLLNGTLDQNDVVARV